MAHLKLTAQPRDLTGKKVKQLRRDGLIPAVVYGGKLDEAISLQIQARELFRVINQAGMSSVIDLEVASNSYPVLTKTVQRDPVRNNIVHVDFLSVRLDQLIQAVVPVAVVGESPTAENNEGILSQLVDQVTVEALPDRLPSQLEVDVSGLIEIGDSLSAGDLTLDEGVTLATDPELVIVRLAPPARVPLPEELEGEELEGEELEGEELEGDVQDGEDEASAEE